jgi:hypothetical protein
MESTAALGDWWGAGRSEILYYLGSLEKPQNVAHFF